jgi:hypothetical protein
VSDPEQDRFWTCTGQQYCGTKEFGTGRVAALGSIPLGTSGEDGQTRFAMRPDNTMPIHAAASAWGRPTPVAHRRAPCLDTFAGESVA